MAGLSKASALCLILVAIIFICIFSDWVLLGDNELVYKKAKKLHHVLLNGCGVLTTSNASSHHDNAASTQVNETLFNGPLYCSDTHQKAVEFCTQAGKNRVPKNEYSRAKLPYADAWGELRSYTLSAGLEHKPLLPSCQSIDEYLLSVKYGTRSWPTTAHSGDETKPSLFLPYKCYTPTLPPSKTKTCTILNQYSHVIFMGDSIGRHLRNAIYMSMRGDYIKTHHIRGAECICDGIFSEKKACRYFQEYFQNIVPISKIEGGQLCTNNESFILGMQQSTPFVTQKTGQPDPGGYIDWTSVDCTNKLYRGILIVANGGLYFQMDASTTFDKVIQPMITHPKFETCLRYGKVNLIWIAMHSISTHMESYYPHQSRKNALAFNRQMTELFTSSGLVLNQDVMILDTWNMTQNSQSSDGLHLLSDVNLAKAAQVLGLVELWPFPKSYSTLLGNNTST